MLQENPTYYFSVFENKLEKALDNYKIKNQIPREIILKYYKRMAGLKNYRYLVYHIMDKETLKTHPDMVETCKKLVMSYIGEGRSTK